MTSKSIIGAFGFPEAKGDFNPREFERLYEETILKSRNSEPVFKQKKSFSPSTIGYGHGTCPRYWHIAFTGTEFTDKFDSLGISMMDQGTGSHDRIQNVMAEMGVLKDREFKIINYDPPVFGFGDVLIYWDDHEIVGEIKTTGDTAFVHRQMGKPSISNLIQILIYMKVLGLDEGFLFYENRSDGKIAVISVSLKGKNEEIADAVFQWMKDVYDNWNSGGPLPARPFQQRNKICQNCPVYDTCWNKLDKGEPITINIDEENVRVVSKLPLEDFKT